MKILENKKYDLACLGILVLDVFGKPIEKFPEKGTSEYFDTMEIHPGGCAYNTGVDGARLGMRVSVLGKVGKDSFGDIMVQSLRKEGVNTSGVRCSDETNTAFSFVMIPEDGQRRLFHTFGVNRTYSSTEVSKDIIRCSRIFHIAGASLLPALDGKPIVELLRFAQQNKILTSLDPVVRKDIADLILPCLPHLDIFLPNNDESVHITGLKTPEDQLHFYLDAGAKVVGIKLGQDGVLVGNGKDTLRLPAFKVPVVDTCGAGDAFVAGFLYGTLQEWNLEKTALFASATAAFCVQAIGATTAIPISEQVLTFINERKQKCL